MLAAVVRAVTARTLPAGCSTVKDMVKKCDEWKKELSNDKTFTLFYNWVMEFMRGTAVAEAGRRP